MLLAIDTSAGTSVAVVDGPDRVLAERIETDTRSHAEKVGTLIAAVLADAGITASDVDAVAAGLGPGPFTGLRVGIAAARAFALGRGVPVIGVPSHAAVALDAEGSVIVVTDARRRELAWTAFAATEPAATGIPVAVRGPELVRADEAEALFATLTAPGAALAGAVRVDAQAIPAGGLGLLAARLRAAGAASSVLEPLYLRPPDVTLSAGPKRVTA
ncbi:tRNA (adenosine(37)-N6)-threonylcarbamoyltransferase complex dimerization subunit type 1 TsaB [Schumannella luteola]|uniref:tRNA threonylcarbamoyl adenosine modification protein YeaZ n=1 Tax=Schumannella luteola TaxID=472059 RepID=A0A852YH13_9MICO|nr:tRNA (adenosine(37)-N6)-threonylcarbamoyltransferase complex dimerization subunit type 1 TsaB [Schumannella luteola]NYH00615.1 tRNA threonylcarbamoyl adenosine modification protein YeaZ [Schumannella luteola]TPX04926.1 tRNA (adenosine(37)-N6)-threonylcarbamoyltransferase complex dimerization subunit type 1 TsaB [Schumannella luteola]